MIARYRQSGQMQQAFCQREELSRSALKYWLYGSKPSPGFVEVRCTDDVRSKVTPQFVTIRVSGMEVIVAADDVTSIVARLIATLPSNGTSK